MPEAILIKKPDLYKEINLVEKVDLPCFVKPTDGGSSLGVTKVNTINDLLPAIKDAFLHGNEVIIEEHIQGREVTCGVYNINGKTKTLPITEIISENEYFDYDAKYNGKSKEITPADLDDKMTNHIKSLSEKIYDILSMKGIVRMDYIIDKKRRPFFD